MSVSASASPLKRQNSGNEGDLQDIYNLNNVEIFIDETDFLIKFIKCVNDFYYSINSKINDTNKQ